MADKKSPVTPKTQKLQRLAELLQTLEESGLGCMALNAVLRKKLRVDLKRNEEMRREPSLN